MNLRWLDSTGKNWEVSTLSELEFASFNVLPPRGKVFATNKCKFIPMENEEINHLE